MIEAATETVIAIIFILVIFVIPIIVHKIYSVIKDKVMAKKEKQSKIDYPEYFEWRRDWYNFKDTADEFKKKIKKQKQIIVELVENRKFICKTDLLLYERQIENERELLQSLKDNWVVLYANRYNQLDDEWDKHEKERRAKGITVWNER